mmetsp:Transcript_91837/g.264253  ORF Transcript_91837/g.264253 Transcript_91837/m.264253 type:complete len:565 (-) Transcript_91837:221-1915(-)
MAAVDAHVAGNAVAAARSLGKCGKVFANVDAQGDGPVTQEEWAKVAQKLNSQTGLAESFSERDLAVIGAVLLRSFGGRYVDRFMQIFYDAFEDFDENEGILRMEKWDLSLQVGALVRVRVSGRLAACSFSSWGEEREVVLREPLQGETDQKVNGDGKLTVPVGDLARDRSGQVFVRLSGIFADGHIRWRGKLPDTEGEWLGVELDEMPKVILEQPLPSLTSDGYLACSGDGGYLDQLFDGRGGRAFFCREEDVFQIVEPYGSLKGVPSIRYIRQRPRLRMRVEQPVQLALAVASVEEPAPACRIQATAEAVSYTVFAASSLRPQLVAAEAICEEEAAGEAVPAPEEEAAEEAAEEAMAEAAEEAPEEAAEEAEEEAEEVKLETLPIGAKANTNVPEAESPARAEEEIEDSELEPMGMPKRARPRQRTAKHNKGRSGRHPDRKENQEALVGLRKRVQSATRGSDMNALLGAMEVAHELAVDPAEALTFERAQQRLFQLASQRIASAKGHADLANIPAAISMIGDDRSEDLELRYRDKLTELSGSLVQVATQPHGRVAAHALRRAL